MERLEQELTNLSPDQRQLVEHWLRQKQAGAALPESQPGLALSPIPLTPGQTWFFEFFAENVPTWWNLSQIFEVERSFVNPVNLEQATWQVLLQHEALRTYFVPEAGGWQQYVAVPDRLQIPFRAIDLPEWSTEQHRAALERAVTEVQQSFDLSEGPLLQVVLFNLGAPKDSGAPGPCYLFITLHHLIADATSLQIVLEDFFTAYRQLLAGRPVELPFKTTALRQWAQRLQTYAQSIEFQRQLANWLALPWEQVPALPIDYPDKSGPNIEAVMASIRVSLSIEETHVLLKDLAKAYKSKITEAVLMALMQTVTEWTGSRWVAVNMIDSGRAMDIPEAQGVDLSLTVGFLAMGSVLFLERTETSHAGERLEAVQAQLRRFPRHGIPLELARLCPQYPGQERFPAYVTELMVNYLGQVSLSVESGPVHPAEIDLGYKLSPAHPRTNLLRWEVYIAQNRLILDCIYSENRHTRATIERLIAGVVAELQALVELVKREGRSASRPTAVTGPDGQVDPQTGSTPGGAAERASGAAERASDFVGPRTPTEETLAQIWQQILGVEEVSVYDNFFELGGDSFLGLRVIAKARQAGLDFTPQQLFQHQTIAALVVGERGTAIQIEDAPLVGSVPLAIAQTCFFERRFPDPNYWNLGAAYEVPADLLPAVMEQSLHHVLVQHDALRSRFVSEAAGWRAFIAAPDSQTPFAYIDLANAPETAQSRIMNGLVNQMQHSLDLAQGPLLRIALLHLGEGRPRHLVLVIHHLVVDQVSQLVIMEDFFTAYQYLIRNMPVQLPRTTSIRQWAARLTAYAQSAELRQEMDYWLSRPWSQIPPLPRDHPTGRNNAGSTRSVRLTLNAEETTVLLEKLPRLYKVSVMEVLLTALVQALTRWTGGRRAAINVINSGRGVVPDAADIDLSRTVGWLSFTGLLMLEQPDTPSPVEAVHNIRQQIQRIPNWGLGYELLLFGSGDAEIIRQLKPFFKYDVLFNYLGRSEGNQKQGSLQPTRESVGMWQDPQNEQDAILYCPMAIFGDRFEAEWDYSENLYEQATVEKVAGDFITALRALIACGQV